MSGLLGESLDLLTPLEALPGHVSHIRYHESSTINRRLRSMCTRPPLRNAHAQSMTERENTRHLSLALVGSIHQQFSSMRYRINEALSSAVHRLIPFPLLDVPLPISA